VVYARWHEMITDRSYHTTGSAAIPADPK